MRTHCGLGALQSTHLLLSFVFCISSNCKHQKIRNLFASLPSLIWYVSRRRKSYAHPSSTTYLTPRLRIDLPHFTHDECWKQEDARRKNNNSPRDIGIGIVCASTSNKVAGSRAVELRPNVSANVGSAAARTPGHALEPHELQAHLTGVSDICTDEILVSIFKITRSQLKMAFLIQLKLFIPREVIPPRAYSSP